MKKPGYDNSVRLIYELENEVFSPGAEFKDHEQAQGYVNEILGSRFWKDNPALPSNVVVYDNGDNNYSECRGRNQIWIAKTQLNQMVALHELAHFYPPADGHGPKFITAYLGLVAQFMGIHFSDQYRRAFVAHGIKF